VEAMGIAVLAFQRGLHRRDVALDLALVCIGKLIAVFGDVLFGRIDQPIGGIAHLDQLAPLLKRYPRLAKVLSLAVQESTLREDGHQLITRWQRKIGPMMLDWGRRAVADAVLPEARDVFDLSTQEFISLVRQPDMYQSFGKTIERRALLEVAETRLEAAWPREGQRFSTYAEKAVSCYAQDLQVVIDLLATQRRMAERNGDGTLGPHYAEERSRLERRLSGLRAQARQESAAYPDAA